MASLTTFVPSAATTLPIAGSTPFNYAMPAVDAGNPDTTVANVGTSVAYLAFAAGGAVGPNAPSSLMLQAGTAVLLTSNTSTLAMSAADPLVMGGGIAQAAATSATFSAVAAGFGTTITIQRGTATARATF